jgi:hypothetical protein
VPGHVAARLGLVEEVEAALGGVGVGRRRLEPVVATPVWFNVMSPITRMPRSCAAATSDASASSPPSAGSTWSKVEASYRCIEPAGKNGVR